MSRTTGTEARVLQSVPLAPGAEDEEDGIHGLAIVDPRAVSENTLRRGFAPMEAQLVDGPAQDDMTCCEHLGAGNGGGSLALANVAELDVVALDVVINEDLAEPVFVDCDPATGNLDPALLELTLSTLRREGRS